MSFVLAWRAWFIENAPYLSFFLALAAPFLRLFLRWCRDVRPAFDTWIFAHDVVGGAMLPNYVLLAICAYQPELLKHIEAHTLLIAGVFGVVYTVAELIGRGPLTHSPYPWDRPR